MPDTLSGAVKNKNKLAIVLAFTSAYMIIEIIGGIWTGSLALLADAGHMVTDVGGLALALFAIKFAERPATLEKTYGYLRTEILAALVNAVILIAISLYILFEAYQRFLNPPTVETGAMSAIAAIGLVVNIAGIFVLRSGAGESLNLKGAYFEVMSDMLSSVGVIVAGIVMWLTGWYYADPIISAAIGLFIIPRTWMLIKETTSILLEGTPAGFNMKEIRKCLESVDGIESVHDLHVWSLTSGVNALTAHVQRKANFPLNKIINSSQRLFSDKFPISHITIQIEDKNLTENETHE